MKCPVCKDVTLLMSEKNGVEIDYCPECRGIWLDRGELDKIIDRARWARDSYDDEPHHAHENDRDHRERARMQDAGLRGTRKKKKESPLSALSDIMEIFGGE